jgi:hypothetical protein
MRSDAELEKMAEQLGDLRDLPADEGVKRFLEVCGDLTREELTRFAEACKRLAALHAWRAEVAENAMRHRGRDRK